MIDQLMQSLRTWRFNDALALYTYWAPALFCFLVYFFRCISMYRTDVKESQSDYYSPSLTVGYVLGHILISVCPVINLFALVFDCLGSFFSWMGTILSVPFVPKKK